MANLLVLPMDRAVLEYLIKHGDNGAAPTIAIPSRLFAGIIPAGHPDLIDLGLIEHRDEITIITSAGREALTA